MNYAELKDQRVALIMKGNTDPLYKVGQEYDELDLLTLREMLEMFPEEELKELGRAVVEVMRKYAIERFKRERDSEGRAIFSEAYKDFTIRTINFGVLYERMLFKKARERDYEDGFLDKSVEVLQFTVRTQNVLKAESIISVRDLVQKSARDLLRVCNFGRQSLREVEEMLAKHGLCLRST